MRRLIVLISAVCLLMESLVANTVIIGQGGRTCVVVLPAQPTVVERTASEEFSRYWEAMGLSRPVVKHESEELPRDVFPVHIGWTECSREFTGLSADAMALDEFVVKIADNAAVLAGHPKRGTLYAVYHLLEKHCGVRWWSVDEETVPVRTSLELPTVTERVLPALPGRDSDGSQFAGNKTKEGAVAWYKVRQRINARASVPMELGGSEADDILCRTSHTAERFVPDEAFFRSHRSWYGEDEVFGGSKPEYFALRDGRRLGAVEGQPCLTNPEVIDVAAANIIKLVARKNPQCKRIWLTQNDNTSYCECPSCLAAVKRLGNRADLNIQFVNEVGERVRRVYPQLEFETFAYQFTLEPPKTVRPADYVHVRVCFIEANAAQPLTHRDNHELLEALRGWTAICRHVNVWYYVTNFINYGLVHPVTETVCQDIRLFHDLGVQECYCEDAADSGQFSWFAVWRGYLCAHLMADPKLDATALREDFFRGYYGPAAKVLMALDDLYEQEIKASGRIVTCFQLDTSHWLKAETLDKGEALLRQAEAAVPSDSVFAKRLRSIRACQDWTRLWRHENTILARVTGCRRWDRSQINDLRKNIQQRLAEIPRTPGWLGLYVKMGLLKVEKVLPLLDGYLADEPPHEALPKELQRVKADDLVILPMARYSVAEGERGIYDYKAPVREATRLRLNSWRWVARIDLPALPPCGTWEILAEMRLPDAVTAPSGIALKTGVYALGTNFAVKTEIPIAADRLSREEYRVFSLGTTDFHRDGQIYFAGVANASVPELLIGRVFLRNVK